jgi:hypothetical protein
MKWLAHVIQLPPYLDKKKRRENGPALVVEPYPSSTENERPQQSRIGYGDQEMPLMI